ncbi:hypothetical protein [Variovorax sp. GT1P44]|uniref:hypothetical protein n=1 Tax=Variovorax sp. GT1P44 TaxID=3443742 RepID=UPI003F446D8B
MEAVTDDAGQLRAAATKAEVAARRAHKAATEAFQHFLKNDGVAPPDQAFDAAKASAKAAQEAWRKYVHHFALHGGHLHRC